MTYSAVVRQLGAVLRQAWAESSRASIVLAVGCGLYAVALMLPLSGKAGNNIAYGLILFPALVAAAQSPKRLSLAWKGALPLLFFLAAVLLVSLFHPSPSGVKSALYVALFLLGTVIVCAEGRLLDRLVYTALALLALSLLATAFVEWVRYLLEHGDHFRTVLWGRSTNPIYAGLLVVSAAVFAWVHLVEPALRQHRLYWSLGLLGLFGICLLAVVVFQARSALLGLILFAVFYAGFRGRIWTSVVLMGSVVAILMMTGLMDAILVRGLSYRPEIWGDALNRLVTECNLLMGCGRTEELFVDQFWGSHSGYVGTLYRHGLIGAGAFTVFACWYFALSIRAKSRWFLVSLVGWGGMLTAMDGFVGGPDAWWVFFWFPTVAAIVESQRAIGRWQHPA